MSEPDLPEAEASQSTAAPAPAPASSDATAARLRLHGDPPRVMRLSRKALMVLGGGGAAVIGGALIYALQPGSDPQGQELYNTDGRATAETINSAPRDYGQVPQLGPALPGDLGRPILAAQDRGADVPVPPIGAAPPAQTPPDPRAAARERAAQERDAARISGLFLGTRAAASGVPSGPSLPSLADLGTMPPSAPQRGEDSVQNGQAEKRDFMNAAADRRTVSAERLAPPASPYIVHAGSIIPAALITGLRSDLPGQVTAQVTAHVYDSPSGRFLLIPQGSRLIGEYDSQISFGQNRLLLAWTRLILPDGRSIVLERQPGADAAGQAGLQDRTNHHWGMMLRAAAISTLLGVGTELASDDDDDLVRALQRGPQDTLNQAGQQIVRRQLNVQPTLTIRPGMPVRVIVTRDLVLAPAGSGTRP
jgi:type IV secretory pathway VirB10-like protein